MPVAPRLLGGTLGPLGSPALHGMINRHMAVPEMKVPAETMKLSSQPDTALLDRFLVVQNICLAAGAFIAAVVLSGWLVPTVGAALPQGWSLMKANTAFSILLCIAGLILTQPKRGTLALFLGRVCGAITIVLAGSALLGYLGGSGFRVDTLLAEDAAAAIPGRMSVHTAAFLLLMGTILIFERTWPRFQQYGADTVVILLVMLVLVITSGYCFDALHLFGHSPDNRTSLHTLVGMFMLVVAAVVRRMQLGHFSMLIGIGIGSQIARVMLPWTLLLPFAIIGFWTYTAEAGWLSIPYAVAIMTATLSMLLFVVNLWMSRRINSLEHDLRNISLTDELTRVHNRRGFYLLGEYLFRDGQRNSTSITIGYFDVDGLKRVNDTFGHDVGSELLFEFASLLRKNFRHSDLIARLGGDEFAVVSRQSDLGSALLRLDDEIEAENRAGKKPYRISYSVGEVSITPTDSESFAEFVARADAAMYETKQQKKAQGAVVGIARKTAKRERVAPS